MVTCADHADRSKWSLCVQVTKRSDVLDVSNVCRWKTFWVTYDIYLAGKVRVWALLFPLFQTPQMIRFPTGNMIYSGRYQHAQIIDYGYVCPEKISTS